MGVVRCQHLEFSPWEENDVEVNAFISQSEEKAMSHFYIWEHAFHHDLSSAAPCNIQTYYMYYTLFLFSVFPKTSFSQLQVCASLTGHWKDVYSHVSSSASLCPISYHPMPILLTVHPVPPLLRPVISSLYSATAYH